MIEVINSFVLPGTPMFLFWLFMGLAVILQGISKSGFAGGAGILSIPLMMLVMPSADKVAATLLPLLVLLDANAVWHFRRDRDWKKVMMIFIPSLFGIAIGSFVWWWIGREGIKRWDYAMKVFVGVISLSFAAYIVGRERAFAWAGKLHPTPHTAWPVGVAAGFISTLIHAAGPLVSLYMYAQGMSKTLFVGTVAWTFALINVAKLPFYFWAGLIDREVLLFDLWLVWIVPLGSWLGRWMHNRVSERLFNRVILVLLIMSGFQMISGINPIQEILALLVPVSEQ